MASQIKRIQRTNNDPFTKLMGLAQVVGGILGAKVTGGASLAAVPGGLAALQNKSSVGSIDSPGGQGASINSVGMQETQLDKMGKVGNLASSAFNIKNKMGSTAPDIKEKVTTSPPEKMQDASALDRRFQQQQQQNEFDVSKMPFRDQVMALGEGEQILNDLDDPQLSAEIKPILFEAMLKAKQFILQGGDNGSNFNA